MERLRPLMRHRLTALITTFLLLTFMPPTVMMAQHPKKVMKPGIHVEEEDDPVIGRAQPFSTQNKGQYPTQHIPDVTRDGTPHSGTPQKSVNDVVNKAQQLLDQIDDGPILEADGKDHGASAAVDEAAKKNAEALGGGYDDDDYGIYHPTPPTKEEIQAAHDAIMQGANHGDYDEDDDYYDHEDDHSLLDQAAHTVTGSYDPLGLDDQAGPAATVVITTVGTAAAVTLGGIIGSVVGGAAGGSVVSAVGGGIAGAAAGATPPPPPPTAPAGGTPPPPPDLPDLPEEPDVPEEPDYPEKPDYPEEPEEPEEPYEPEEEEEQEESDEDDEENEEEEEGEEEEETEEDEEQEEEETEEEKEEEEDEEEPEDEEEKDEEEQEEEEEERDEEKEREQEEEEQEEEKEEQEEQEEQAKPDAPKTSDNSDDSDDSDDSEDSEDSEPPSTPDPNKFTPTSHPDLCNQYLTQQPDGDIVVKSPATGEEQHYYSNGDGTWFSDSLITYTAEDIEERLRFEAENDDYLRDIADKTAQAVKEQHEDLVKGTNNPIADDYQKWKKELEAEEAEEARIDKIAQRYGLSHYDDPELIKKVIKINQDLGKQLGRNAAVEDAVFSVGLVPVDLLDKTCETAIYGLAGANPNNIGAKAVRDVYIVGRSTAMAGMEAIYMEKGAGAHVVLGAKKGLSTVIFQAHAKDVSKYINHGTKTEALLYIGSEGINKGFDAVEEGKDVSEAALNGMKVKAVAYGLGKIPVVGAAISKGTINGYFFVTDTVPDAWGAIQRLKQAYED